MLNGIRVSDLEVIRDMLINISSGYFVTGLIDFNSHYDISLISISIAYVLFRLSIELNSIVYDV